MAAITTDRITSSSHAYQIFKHIYVRTYTLKKISIRCTCDYFIYHITEYYWITAPAISVLKANIEHISKPLFGQSAQSSRNNHSMNNFFNSLGTRSKYHCIYWTLWYFVTETWCVLKWPKYQSISGYSCFYLLCKILYTVHYLPELHVFLKV